MKDGPTPEISMLMEIERGAIKNEIEAQVKAGAKIFHNPDHQIMLIFSVNVHGAAVLLPTLRYAFINVPPSILNNYLVL